MRIIIDGVQDGEDSSDPSYLNRAKVAIDGVVAEGQSSRVPTLSEVLDSGSGIYNTQSIVDLNSGDHIIWYNDEDNVWRFTGKSLESDSADSATNSMFSSSLSVSGCDEQSVSATAIDDIGAISINALSSGVLYNDGYSNYSWAPTYTDGVLTLPGSSSGIMVSSSSSGSFSWYPTYDSSTGVILSGYTEGLAVYNSFVGAYSIWMPYFNGEFMEVEGYARGLYYYNPDLYTSGRVELGYDSNLNMPILSVLATGLCTSDWLRSVSFDADGDGRLIFNDTAWTTITVDGTSYTVLTSTL